jgi:RimJ/RimL family protein N-acetyltransferase
LTDEFQIEEPRSSPGSGARAGQLVEEQDYFLRTARLGFRLWLPEDYPLAWQLWGNPQVSKFLARDPFTEEQVRERLAREIATASCHGIQYWPIFHLQTGEHIGCAGLRPCKPDEGIYELGAHLHVQFWGHGYAREAACGVMHHAFEDLHVKALFAGHHPCNEASRVLLTRLGFRYTHDEFYAPARMDHPCYLLTAEGYRQQSSQRTATPR